MFWSLAWKNLWRNKVRSLIIMTAIALGLLGGLTASALSFGMGEQMIRTAIGTRISHVRIEHPGFLDEQDVNLTVPDARQTAVRIESLPDVAGAAPRVVVTSMASSPVTASGVELLGVVADAEQRVSDVPGLVVEGEWLDTAMRWPVVIGRELAVTLGIGLGSRIVFTFQNAQGTITGGAFRVSGIFRTVSSAFDRSTAYVNWPDLVSLLESDTAFQRISILLTSAAALDTVVSQIERIVPDMRIDTWRRLAPELDFTSEILSTTLYIFMGVILVALAFGIVNTMLMVVLERRREFGMLVAVGMARRTVFGMVVLETLALSLSAALAGMILTALLMAILSRTGIDLSLFAEGLREFGIAEILYPELPWTMYPAVALMTALTAVIASIFPALRALRLRPAQALRTF